MTVFNPREVEVLAAALPAQGGNRLADLTREILVLHTKRCTPGNYSQLIGTGPEFRAIFFPNAGESPYESTITPLTGLDGGFFAALSVAMLCQQMAAVASTLRPQLLTGKINDTINGLTTAIRQNSFRYYAYLARYADTPIKNALAAFPDEASRALARQHYLAGLTSASWVNAKLVQDSTGSWPDRDWELYHHWIKLTAVGASIAEIDAAITTMMSLGLPVPPSLRPGSWHLQAPWLNAGFSGADMADANGPIVATKCTRYPGARSPSCMAEDNSFEFTALTQPGNGYRQVPASSCLAPGTRVVMADRTLKQIQDIEAGESVLTPQGSRSVILRSAPLRGQRTLVQFDGLGFAFAATHPFLVHTASDPLGATYAAADPQGLARTVPTLSQFGLRGLHQPGPAILVRHTEQGDVAFPAPSTHDAPTELPELLYDLYLEVGPDGRSEYYAGDEHTQLLVSSEIPRFAVAPQTTAVVLHVLRAAGPTVLETLANVPDESFDDVLGIGLDGLARTMMPTIGRKLTTAAGVAELPHTAEEVACAVRLFADSLNRGPGGAPQRRMGMLVEQFTARFGPQFQAVLALPWRTFDLAESDVANILAVTPYSVELFEPGPPASGATVELVLRHENASFTRLLPVQPSSPADRWYYTVDRPAYFPEWTPSADDSLWYLEIAVLPHSHRRMRLALPGHIAHGYQAFAAPVLDGDKVVGQAWLDVRLLTVEAYAAEALGRAAGPSADPIAGRLAHLAARFVRNRFAETVFALQYCTATTTVTQLADTSRVA
ncbi:hypothetical protein Rhe02_02820 [Rhizocola hellebori]|uniref:Vint domain-containing protein n=1 Tax=Rhizocola hellebori TaxID=1392758 RepID=A0A8J3VCY9_9ACTN|nr:hypothetical protein [Rhizocola hellebori]GIH02215.1 hypothetical protein Rhe02_02820 [Rhizocola hellebori]